MTPEALQRIIASGESLHVEFKSDARSPLNDRGLVEAAACMANQQGVDPSYLLIGIEDDGTITGARPRHGDHTDPSKVAALIANRTRPALGVVVSVVKLADREVVSIEVPSQTQAIATGDGVMTCRTLGGDGKPCCLPMDAMAVLSMQADRGRIDASAQAVPAATWADLDALEFERFRRNVRESRGRGDESLLELGDRELARALGVVDGPDRAGNISLAALLLFGATNALKRLVPSHEVAFQAMRGLDVEVNDFLCWPLLRTMEEIETRIRARNREQELMVGLLRVGVPDWSERALREALANALIHRDYQRLGAVHFQWHPDRIEVSSPGGFPQGVRLDNLLVTAPRPRNPLLADAFKRAGIVERTARGIDTIYSEQLRNGRPVPSWARSNETTVTVVIPGGAANLDFVRLLVTEAQDKRAFDLDAMLVLNALWQERKLITATAAALIQKPESDARAVLHNLVESGLVEERGTRKGRTWHLSAAAYRALGDKAAYVRQHGFEPLQHKQMVMEYVEKHGEVTRKDTAELCRLSSPQAYRLLKGLVDQELLDQVGGRGRGVRYRKHGP